MRLAATFFAVAAVLASPPRLALTADPARDADAAFREGIGVMLNTLTDTERGCRLVFAFSNRTGRRLDAYGMDLTVLDGDDRPIRHVPARTRGLPASVITATSFVVNEIACARIAAVRLDGIFACRADGQRERPDCDALTTPSSRARVSFQR